MTKSSEANDARRDRLSVLAHADPAMLLQLWRRLGLDPECQMLRGPETGLVTLRGRIGGGGAPFNLGEATVSRASVRLGDGAVGHAAVLGRDHVKVKLAAVIDALCGDAVQAARIDADLVAPIRAALGEEDARKRAETAATKVEFFTMVRGED